MMLVRCKESYSFSHNLVNEHYVLVVVNAGQLFMVENMCDLPGNADYNFTYNFEPVKL